MASKFKPGDVQVVINLDLPERNKEPLKTCLDYLSDFSDLELSIRMNDKVKLHFPDAKRVKQVIAIYATDTGIRIATNLNDAGTIAFIADALRFLLTTSGSHDYAAGTLKNDVRTFKI